jgi:riboflavin kinase/FMN adenylyltransferase
VIVFRDFPSPEEAKGITHLSLGFFDGLHRGHVQVIEAAAGASPVSSSCLMTFWPHPQSVLYPDASPRLLMGLEQKIEAVGQLGLSSMVIVPFDKKFSCQSAERFLTTLRERFPSLRHLSVGPNFRFGHQREGTPEVLQEWCNDGGINFHCPPLLTQDGHSISSSRIRSAITNGDLDHASSMLGYPYGIWGRVVRGDGRGRILGYPTVNLETEEVILPPDGVYSGMVTIQKITYTCAINIGARPTVDSVDGGKAARVEAHILDFDGDLYGHALTIQPRSKIREQIKFESKEALTRQIQQDVQLIRDCIPKP